MKFSNCCILFLFTLCTASQRIFYSQDFILHLAKCVFLCFYQFFNVHMVDSTVLCMLYPNSNGCFTHSFIPSFIHLFFLMGPASLHKMQHLWQLLLHSSRPDSCSPFPAPESASYCPANVPAVSAPESNFSEPQPASVLTSFCFVSQKPYIYRIQIASIYHRIARS